MSHFCTKNKRFVQKEEIGTKRRDWYKMKRSVQNEEIRTKSREIGSRMNRFVQNLQRLVQNKLSFVQINRVMYKMRKLLLITIN